MGFPRARYFGIYRSMPSTNQIARITSAMGDPVRINMLLSLRFEGELTASEVAKVGNVAPSTASEHLSRMVAANLITQQRVGRTRLYKIADESVCDLLDVVYAVAERAPDTDPGKSEPPDGLLHARLCFDHLAGHLGCEMTNALFAQGALVHGRKGLEVSAAGENWFRQLGIDPHQYRDRPRCALRLCRDWSKDSHHLGGGMASALLDLFRQRDWIRTRRGELRVYLTPKGREGFRKTLGLDLRNTGCITA